MDRGNIIVTGIKDAVTVSAFTGKRITISNRPSNGLSFCKSGKITYTHNGKEFISVKGYAVFLPAGATYELYNNSGGDFPLINFYGTNGDDFNEIKVVRLDDEANALNNFKKLQNLLIFKDRNYAAMSLFYEMLDEIFTYSESNRRLNSVIKYISKNISNSELDNSALAHVAEVSESYLRRSFKAEFKTTPKQYIIDLRIKKSKQLLKENCKTVTEISYECGFASVYHFCRAFKECVGITPSDYRKKHLKFGI